MDEAPEFGTTGKPHPYHMVRPSPWPLISAFAAGLLAVGVVMMVHGVEFSGFEVGWKGVAAGLVAVLVCMFFWWRDVIMESVREKAHTKIAEIGMRYGMLLFILSEVMFFAAFFWAYFNASLFPTEEIGSVWPPEGIDVIPAFDLPFLMTMILLLSGNTVTWAHHEVLHGRQKEATQALAVTVALGVVFLCFQVYEYTHASFAITDGIYGSTFYMATGFHGFHVFIGTIFLAVCLFRSMKGHFTPDRHFGFEAAAWYWHFVDIVWLFLFVSIYWMGAA